MVKPQVVRYDTIGRPVRRRYVGRAFRRGPWKWTTPGAYHFGYRNITHVTHGLHPQMILRSGAGSAYGWEDNGTKFVVSQRGAYSVRQRAEAR